MKNRQQAIREFIAACEWQYKKELPQMLRPLWLRAFDDVQPERLCRAMEQWLTTSKFFPLPEDIREVVRQLPQSPEETAGFEKRRRERLLARIDWNPKQLPSLIDTNPVKSLAEFRGVPEAEVERIVQQAIQPKRPMSAEEIRQRAEEQRQRLLAKNACSWDGPFPNLPELRLPLSHVPDFEYSGGEAEGLVM